MLQSQKSFADHVNTNTIDENIEGSDSVETLSKKLNTLKRQIRRHMSLLRLMRKSLTVIVEKQSLLS